MNSHKPNLLNHSWLLLLAVLLHTSGCRKLGICKDKEFDFARVENLTGHLQLHGYYYGLSTEDTLQESALIYLLFQNGVYYEYGSVNRTDAEQGNIDFNAFPPYYSSKTSWGIYKIEEQIRSGETLIECQSWMPVQFGCHEVATQTGTVQNDSTFTMTAVSTTKVLEVNDVEMRFHFVPYSPKPDSAVAFFGE